MLHILLQYLFHFFLKDIKTDSLEEREATLLIRGIFGGKEARARCILDKIFAAPSNL
jgi:hypothetical protein